MKEWMITNCVIWGASSIAITVACYVTKSAWPLLGFMLVPRANMKSGDRGEEA